MSRDERINALEEKVEAYEKILEKALEGPYQIGEIVAGPEGPAGLYRIRVAGSPDAILPANPKDSKLDDLKTGTKVLFSKNLIVDVLPGKLEITTPPIEFDFIKWDSIGGMKSQIERIRDAVEFPILHADKFKEYGINPVKGIMLYGPPGCGKTLIAKAIASTILREKSKITEDSFIYLKGGEMLSPYVGVAESNIKDVFDRCRKNFKKTKQRSVIFIDEAEAILPIRGSRHSSDVDTTIVPTFLSEMDGFETNSSLIILATNNPHELDPAIVRPGRIDLKVEITKPSLEDSHEIFEIYFKKIKTEENVQTLAKESSQFLFNSPLVKNVSGAMISLLVQQSSMEAIKRQLKNQGEKGITIQDIKLSINNF